MFAAKVAISMKGPIRLTETLSLSKLYAQKGLVVNKGRVNISKIQQKAT